jgi:hypothetical protein
MKKISNYHDLVAEKQRLNQKITLLRRDIDNEVHEIKERFKPIAKILGILGVGAAVKASSNGSTGNSLLKMGATLGVDLLVGSKLRKAGMLTRMIVPSLVRGVTGGVIDKVKHFFSKKK